MLIKPDNLKVLKQSINKPKLLIFNNLIKIFR